MLPHQFKKYPPRLAAGARGGGDVAAGAAQRILQIGALELHHEVPFHLLERA